MEAEEVLHAHGVYQCEDLTFFSDFDSGNLARAERVAPNTVFPTQYELWVCPDAVDRGSSAYRTWFHFGVRGARKGAYVKLALVNLSPIKSMYGNRYKPVYRLIPGQTHWSLFGGDVSYEVTTDRIARLSWLFEVELADCEIFFAFTFPYPYEQVKASIDIHEKAASPSTYFYREIMTRSLEGRDVELITVSEVENFSEAREARTEGCFPTDVSRCHAALKPVVLVTCRVHPGETPGSFMLDGFLAAMLSQHDRRSQLLRKNFVFKVIPILNPDGVYHGNYRLDINGENLNRCYIDPDRASYPVIYAVKKYAEYLHSLSSLRFFMDFHAQSSKPSGFLFGNALEEDQQVEAELYAKLVSLNTHLFNFVYCDFSERSMYSKDPKDHHSKEGSSRVAVHRSTGLTHCYTVECSYFAGRGAALPAARKSGFCTQVSSCIPAYFELGACMAWTLLDYYQLSPLPKGCEFANVEAVRNYVRTIVLLDKTKSRMTRKSSSHYDSKSELRRVEPGKIAPILGKTTPRAVHHLKVVSPMLNIDVGRHLPPLDRSKEVRITKTRRVVSVESKIRHRA